jgi:hypothetical protein
MGDLDWAAGFLEGEGSFLLNNNRGRPAVPTVKATQTDEECLKRLQTLFGGSVCQDDRTKPGRDTDGYSRKMQYEWRISGQRALDFMRTIYPLMSARRQEQIDRVRESL